MAETQGTSAMGLYNAHSGAASLGMETAGALHSYEMGERQKMVPPTGGQDMRRPANAPEWYNYSGMAPAKYAVPNEMKDRMVARAAIREAAADVGSNAVPRPDPIRDEEVDYLQMMQRQAELADFDRYINTLVDPRKPGNLKWLMEVYPEFVHRRVAQVHDDYSFAIRKQMIENWGVNTFDDLHFLYMVDNKKIDGPSLSKRAAKDDGYKTGVLSPLTMYSHRPKAGVNLPFSSASVGQRPTNIDGWQQNDENQPLSGERGVSQMARNVMSSPGDLRPDFVTGSAPVRTMR